MAREIHSDRVAKRKSRFIPRFILIISIVVFVALASFISYKIINKKIHNSDSVPALYDNWNLYSLEGYQKVYDISNNILKKKSFHNTALTFHGYSAFYLSQYELDPAKAQEYLDSGIVSLRIAMQSCKNSDTLAQIHYMLGKSYFYKNRFSSYHYYSDLAIQYLGLAVEEGYKADDIAELMGLSYASLGEIQKSIESFTEALLVRESDTLLFNIAKQYFSNNQGAAAKQYLFRVINTSKNDELLNDSHFLLGQIYVNEGNFAEAEKEFLTILEKNENSGDAYYGLGVLYEKQGDNVKARSMWRKALKVQVNHAGTLKKMTENK